MPEACLFNSSNNVDLKLVEDSHLGSVFGAAPHNAGCPPGQGHVRPDRAPVRADMPIPSCHPVASSRIGGAKWRSLAKVDMDIVVNELPATAGRITFVEKMLDITKRTLDRGELPLSINEQERVR